MSRAQAVLVVLFGWIPIVGVLVLAGVAFGWWATLVGALPFIVFGLLALGRLREGRDRPPPDPAALRAELVEIDRRAIPWIRAWTSCFLVLTVFGVVLLLVTAFQMR